MEEIDIPYYPKGYGVQQALKNMPLHEFKTKDADYLISEYGSLTNFVDRIRDIRDFFKTTKEEAISRIYEKIEEEELFDEYYEEKYEMTRQDAIDNDLQTEEDLLYEKETMMAEDDDTIFDFTIGIDEEEMKEFLDQLAQFHLLVLEEGFRRRGLSLAPIDEIRRWMTPHFDIEEIEERQLALEMGNLLLNRRKEGGEIGKLDLLNSDTLDKIYEKI